jgi:hypothetical protein
LNSGVRRLRGELVAVKKLHHILYFSRIFLALS